jgi:galactokinase
VGANTGILDQYTAVFGRAGCALLLDCRYLSNEAVPIHRDISIIICDTRAKRELTGTAYGERRAACEEGARAFGRVEPGVLSLRDVTPEAWGRHAGLLAGPVADRCRFIIEENRRVPAMAAALRDGDWDAIGALTAASYEGARDLFEIVGEEMAAMMAAMRAAPGIIGARQSGGGFGGCMVAFAKAGCEEDFAAQVVSAYRAASGLDAQVFAVRAGPGAGAVETG